MNKLIAFALVITCYSCETAKHKKSSAEWITNAGQQNSIFLSLVALTKNNIPENRLEDSLAFLVLPVKASCPSCRGKTIDSIVKYQNRLVNNHFIIISDNGGRKSINGYFKEENAELPVIRNKLFLDSTGQATKFKLFDEQPTMYYTHRKKAYKKVMAIPSTVREDLKEFFSGPVQAQQLAKNN